MKPPPRAWQDAGPDLTGHWDAATVAVLVLAWPLTLTLALLLWRASTLDLPNGGPDHG